MSKVKIRANSTLKTVSGAGIKSDHSFIKGADMLHVLDTLVDLYIAYEGAEGRRALAKLVELSGDHGSLG